MSDVIRVIRVLEYVGHREAVEKQLSQNYVKGLAKGISGVTIREAIVGPFPEIIRSEENA